ncbi:hypothetical protein CPB85DRAFT_667780 [Mucidula mucida]|nr:hypothetical protein CPB85DRAFT_667780 [Mucidula mucida]
MFKKLFDQPTKPGEVRLGSSLSSAIMLDAVNVEEFDRFLWVFYNPLYSDYSDATFDDWAVILRLAQRWRFPLVKKLAVRELQAIKNVDLVDRIILYKLHDVDHEYLSPLYVKLCSRDEPLTQVESQKLGVETTVLIFQARERLRSRGSDELKSPLPGDVDHSDVLKVVAEILGDSDDEFSGSSHHKASPTTQQKKAGSSVGVGRPKYNRLE